MHLTRLQVGEDVKRINSGESLPMIPHDIAHTYRLGVHRAHTYKETTHRQGCHTDKETTQTEECRRDTQKSLD